MRDLARYFIAAPTIRLQNQTQQNYQQVKVTLHIGGDAFAAEARSDPELDPHAGLPYPPRDYGDRRESLLGPTTINLPGIYRPPMPDLWPRTEIEHGGSVTLTLPTVDLRPGELALLEDDVALLIPASRADTVVVSWTATATNVDGIASGDVTLTFDADAVDVYAAAMSNLT